MVEARKTVSLSGKVLAARLGTLRDKIEALNKRAAKLGLSGLTLHVGAETTVSTKDESGIEHVLHYREVTIEGEAPELAGWTFTAAISHIETGALIRPTPAGEGMDLSKWRDAANKCDHCGLIRNRKDTFLLRHENGDEKQVGRDCLKDFTGHDVEGLIWRLGAWDSIRDALGELGNGGGCDSTSLYVNLKTWMDNVAAVVRLYGYVSKKKAEEDFYGRTATTKDSAWLRMTLKKRTGMDPEPLREDDTKLADESILLMKELGEKRLAGADLSDYEYNLAVAGAGDRVHEKALGIAASAVTVALRNREDAARAKNSKHFGTVGKRETFTLKLVSRRGFESMYGGGTILKFVDTSGNEAVWFTSSSPMVKNEHGGFEGVIDGKTYKVKATVKAHEFYKNVPQTTLSRAVVLEEVK